MLLVMLISGRYMAAERKETIDFTDPAVQKDFMNFQSLMIQGRGSEILFS